MRDWLRRWLEIEERPSPPIHVRADPAPESVVQPALDHSIRWWNAEEENSRRLSRRVSLLLTAIAAFLGIGLIRLGTPSLGPALPQLESPFQEIFTLLLGVGLILLIIATLYLVGFPRRSKRNVDSPGTPHREQRPRFASFHLPFDVGTLKSLLEVDPDIGSAEYFRLQAFESMSKAAEDLMRRNSRVLKRIDVSQRWFGGGLMLILIALIVHAAAPSP